MITEYMELVQHDELNGKQRERDQNEGVPQPLKRNFSTLVHLESQCKIMHYELNNLSLELKDAYFQMTDTIEELERFKADMVESLSVQIVKQAKIMLTSMRSLLGEMKNVEQSTLVEFQNMLDQNPFKVQSLGPELATLAKMQTLLEIDDYEEANLSEYEGSPLQRIGTIDRYSDLRGSSPRISKIRGLGNRTELSVNNSASASPFE